MAGKLDQFQKEVRPGQEEMGVKMLKKAGNGSSNCVSYSIPLVTFLSHLVPGLTW